MKIDRQPGAGTQPRRLLHDACFLWPTPAMTFSLQGASISTYLDESAEIRNQRISGCCSSAIHVPTCHEFWDSANVSQDLSRLAAHRPDARWPAGWAASAHESATSATHGPRLRRKTWAWPSTTARSAATVRARKRRWDAPLRDCRWPWKPRINLLDAVPPRPADVFPLDQHDIVNRAKCPADTQFPAASPDGIAEPAARRLRRHNALVT